MNITPKKIKLLFICASAANLNFKTWIFQN